MVNSSTVELKTLVELQGVTRRFGAITALDNVTLSVPRGAVFGLVGVNGAGKTTLLKHVLGLLKAQTGSVRVFGLDPVADPVGVLSKVGCLSEDNDLPDWMRVDELFHYSRAFYPSWDEQYVEQLRQAFELDPAAKIKHLSRGQHARTGLLVALAECCFAAEPARGVAVTLGGKQPLEAVLFGEEPSRLLLEVDKKQLAELLRLAREYRVEARQLGWTSAGEFRVHFNRQVVLEEDIATLREVWQAGLPQALQTVGPL